MAFNVVRQPLIPAFLTLAAISVAAITQVGDIASTTIPDSLDPFTTLPATLLTRFQTIYPGWSHFAAGFIILFTGLCLGRISTRYGLYSTNSCMAIPLYGIIACTIFSHNDYLAVFTASLLLALTTQNFCRSSRNGYAFDPVFRASFYLGFIPFIYPTALPLLLLLPLAILLYQRTLRELTVALVGMLLPAALICYISWACGYDFTAPLMEIRNFFIAGKPMQFFFTQPPVALGFTGAIILFTLAAILFFLSNAYTTGSKPRLILTYNIGMFLVAAALVTAPSANSGVNALLAIPAALLLPVFFVRIHHAIATPVYLILLVGTFIGIFLL